MNACLRACRALTRAGVRFVVIGVWDANHHARTTSTVLLTRDVDLFLPPDPRNLFAAWAACRAAQFTVWDEDEPLDAPQTAALADAIVARRALTTAVDGTGVGVDLTLSMSRFAFAEVDAAKKEFLVDDVTVPVAPSPTSFSPRPMPAASRTDSS